MEMLSHLKTMNFTHVPNTSLFLICLFAFFCDFFNLPLADQNCSSFWISYSQRHLWTKSGRFWNHATNTWSRHISPFFLVHTIQPGEKAWGIFPRAENCRRPWYDFRSTPRWQRAEHFFTLFHLSLHLFFWPIILDWQSQPRSSYYSPPLSRAPVRIMNWLMTKTEAVTKTRQLRKHPKEWPLKLATLETCDPWNLQPLCENHDISDDWEHQSQHSLWCDLPY